MGKSPTSLKFILISPAKLLVKTLEKLFLPETTTSTGTPDIPILEIDLTSSLKLTSEPSSKVTSELVISDPTLSSLSVNGIFSKISISLVIHAAKFDL